MMTSRVKTVNRNNDLVDVTVEFDDGAGFITTKLYTIALADDVSTTVFAQRVRTDAAELERQNALAAQYTALIGPNLLA